MTTTRTLALVRDQTLDLHDLAGFLGDSLEYTAGMLEAITGDDSYLDACLIDGTGPGDDYYRGLMVGTMLVEEETAAACWAEVYALPEVPAPECGPVDPSDVPF